MTMPDVSLFSQDRPFVHIRRKNLDHCVHQKHLGAAAITPPRFRKRFVISGKSSTYVLLLGELKYFPVAKKQHLLRSPLPLCLEFPGREVIWSKCHVKASEKDILNLIICHCCPCFSFCVLVCVGGNFQRQLLLPSPLHICRCCPAAQETLAYIVSRRVQYLPRLPAPAPSLHLRGERSQGTFPLTRNSRSSCVCKAKIPFNHTVVVNRYPNVGLKALVPFNDREIGI